MLITLVDILFLLIALALIVNALFPGWRTSAWDFAFTPQVLITLLIELVVLAIVWYVVVLILGALAGAAAGSPHPAALGAGAVGLLLLGSINPTPEPDPIPTPVADPESPPGLPYAVSWWIGLLIALFLAAATLIQVNFAAGNGAAMGIDTRAAIWLSIAAGVVGLAGRFFPNVQHTVGTRLREFHRAALGRFPRDVHG